MSKAFDIVIGGIVILAISMMLIDYYDDVRSEREFRTKCSEFNGITIKQDEGKFVCLSSEVVIG